MVGNDKKARAPKMKAGAQSRGSYVIPPSAYLVEGSGVRVTLVYSTLPFNYNYSTSITHIPTSTTTTYTTPTTMTGQHDNNPVQTVIYKPNEHADEYIVAIDDVAEVGPPSLSSRVGSRTDVQYEQWKTDKSIALSRFVGQFAIVSHIFSLACSGCIQYQGRD